jgi:hypothetical protein
MMVKENRLIIWFLAWLSGTLQVTPWKVPETFLIERKKQ